MRRVLPLVVTYHVKSAANMTLDSQVFNRQDLCRRKHTNCSVESTVTVACLSKGKGAVKTYVDILTGTGGIGELY